MADVLTHLTAGTIAGVTGVLVDYPLDTMKTHMQARCPSSPGSYTQCAARLYHRGGVGSFYRGLSVPLAAQGAEAAIVFSVYNTALHQFRKSESTGALNSASPPSIWSSSAYWKASACAGLAVSFVLTPVEMLKCNLQMESGRPQRQQRRVTVRSLALKLHRTNGVCGFYRGMTGTATRAVLGNVAYFLSYEQCKQWLTPSPATSSSSQHSGSTAEAQEDDAATPSWHFMLAGGISGCLYWSIAYPADVVKTQMQVCTQANAAGFGRTFQNFYQTGGVRALYRGWAVTAVRAFVSSAVVFTTYELTARAIADLCPLSVPAVRDAVVG